MNSARKLREIGEIPFDSTELEEIEVVEELGEFLGRLSLLQSHPLMTACNSCNRKYLAMSDRAEAKCVYCGEFI
jgi:hypothetical protein